MPSAKVRAEAAQRRSRALQLRLAGLSFEAIGDQLGGVSAPRAYQLYREALTLIVKEPNEQIVQVEIERLDMLYRALLPKALAGSPRHAEVAVRVLESKRKLLGVDAPTKVSSTVDVTIHDGIDAEIEQLMERMRDRDPDPAASG